MLYLLHFFIFILSFVCRVGYMLSPEKVIVVVLLFVKFIFSILQIIFNIQTPLLLTYTQIPYHYNIDYNKNY